MIRINYFFNQLFIAVCIGLILLFSSCATIKPNSEKNDIPKDHPLFSMEIEGHRYSYFEEIEFEGRGVIGKGLFDDGRVVIDAKKINGKNLKGTNLIYFFEKNSNEKKEYVKDNIYSVKGFLRDSTFFAGERKITFELSMPIKEIEVKNVVPINSIGSFQGKARNIKGKAAIVSLEGIFLLDGLPAWRKNETDKTIKVDGIISGQGIIKVSSFLFVFLSQFIGQPIVLDGKTYSMNRVWWFDYDGQKIIISNIEKLDSWKKIQHGYKARVSGILFKELRLSYSGGHLVDRWVIKNPKVEVNTSINKESDRFSSPYFELFGYSNGLPEYISESFPTKNLMAWMTKAWFYLYRNILAIDWIIKNNSRKTREVLRARLNENGVDPDIKLLYAGTLAYLNDDQGLDYLIKIASEPSNPQFEGALGTLGYFFYQKRSDSQRRESLLPKIETFMIKSIRENGDKAINIGQFHYALIESNSIKGIKLLLEKAKVKDENSDPEEKDGWDFIGEGDVRYEIIKALLNNKSSEILKEISQLGSDKTLSKRIRIEIIKYLYSNKHPSAAQHVIENFESCYYELFKMPNITQEVVKRLEVKLPDLKDENLRYAKMYLLCHSKNPVDSIINELKKEDCFDRNFMFFSLEPISNKRVVKEVFTILKSCKNDFLNQDDFDNYLAIEHALEAIKAEKTSYAIYYLIQLLDADFRRFNISKNLDNLNNLVVKHLIDLTDISFGLNKPEWEKWFKLKYPKFVQ